MKDKQPNFAHYLSDILDYGPFESQTDAAQYIGIKQSHFNMILHGLRTNLTYEIGNKIIKAHYQIMEETPQ